MTADAASNGDRFGEAPTFSPCPICGNLLTMWNVGFYDDDGNELAEHPERKMNHVTIWCNCGYSFSKPASAIGWPIGRWMERFAAEANKRFVEVSE